MDQPGMCTVIDLGDSVLLTVARTVGHSRRRIQAPISRVLRIMRDMGWQVVEIRHDIAGHLCVYLDRFDEDEEPGPQTVSQRRILIEA